MSKGGGSNTSEYTKPVTDTAYTPFTVAPDECVELNLTTPLQFIVMSALSKVCIDEFLPLQLHRTINRVEMLNAQGEVCGAITSKELATLINCINKGNSFHAKIIKLSAGSCTVLVQNAKR